MLHTVYRTTNSLNGGFYIGYHKTVNPDDSYLGSGLFLRRAIAKYGQENFHKEVIAVFDNARDAFARERELLANCWGQAGCYNIHEGGYGGFEYINKNGLGHTPEVVERIRRKNTGQKRSEAVCAAFSQARHGRKLSDSWKESLRRANLGKKKSLTEAGRHRLQERFLGKPAWNKGGSMPLGFGERIAAAKRGKARPPNVGLAVAIANRGRPPVRWINRDGVALKIEVSKLSSFLAEGWKLGRKSLAP